MPSLKSLKNRVASVKSTKKITTAKQMVAAAKLRCAEKAAKAAHPYTERIKTMFANLFASSEGNLNAPMLLSGTGVEKTELMKRAPPGANEKKLVGILDAFVKKFA